LLLGVPERVRRHSRLRHSAGAEAKVPSANVLLYYLIQDTKGREIWRRRIVSKLRAVAPACTGAPGRPSDGTKLESPKDSALRACVPKGVFEKQGLLGAQARLRGVGTTFCSRSSNKGAGLGRHQSDRESSLNTWAWIRETVFGHSGREKKKKTIRRFLPCTCFRLKMGVFDFPGSCTFMTPVLVTDGDTKRPQAVGKFGACETQGRAETRRPTRAKEKS